MVLKLKKRGQVTIFVILAIVLVALVAGYFLIVDNTRKKNVSSEFDPVYNQFSSCLENVLFEGDQILKTHGGVIDVPIVERASLRNPFTNKLEYGGIEIPYWFYYSASGLERSNIPEKRDMEKELELYLNKKWDSCVDSLSDSEFDFFAEKPERISVEILNNKIRVEIGADVVISNFEDSSSVEEHYLEIDSNLGNLYESAKVTFYEEENESLIGNYSIDILRLYAPVDGVEFSCSPLTWNANEVFYELMNGFEQNFRMLNNYGDKKDYYNLDSKISENIEVVYSTNWPSFFEVEPSQDALMISQPVGNQQGLEILGFCYVPFHFVYNVKIPVLIKVSEDDEFFQFPFVLSIDKNRLDEIKIEEELYDYQDVCSIEGKKLNLKAYDLDLNPIGGAEIYYDCLGQSCFVGQTNEGGVYEGSLPSCVNGILKVKDEEFKESSMVYSSINEGSATFVLNELYDQDVGIYVGSKEYMEEAVVNFYSEDYSAIVNYPLNDRVSISEGEYEISVYLYGNSSFDIPATTTQCFEVPRGGVGGLFGFTSEECVEVPVSEDFSSKVLVGGGKTNYFFSEDELKESNMISIEIEGLFKTESFDDLQRNYNLLEQNEIEVSLR